MKAKIIKRIGATIMASIMMLAMGTSAFARTTVNAGSGDNSLVIHKFQQPSTATGLPNDGTELSDAQIAGLTPVSGIEFKVYSATLNSGAASGSTDSSDYTLTQVAVGSTASDGELEFTGLADGLYYVQETASATSTDVSSFFVNLPMTNPTGNGTLSEVHVYPKNSMADASITKKVIDENGDPGLSTDADVGDDVTWQITAVVPGEFANANTSTGTTDYYKITDVLDKALTYQSAVVKLGSTTLTAGTDYTVTPTTNTDGTTTVVISFTETGMAKLVAALATSDATITVDLTTKINENAYDGMQSATGDYAIKNQASYDWKVGDQTGTDETPDPTDPTDPDVPSVVVTGLLIYKTDENEDPLSGASFKVANGNDDTATGYIAALEKTTNTNGYVYWKSDELDLTFGTNLGIFYALETAAPTGYAAITGHLAFDELTATNVSAVLKLQNFPANFDLPLTGGAGTLLFTVGGLLLLAAAGAITLISRRKRMS